MRTAEEIKEVLVDIEVRLEALQEENMDLLTVDSVKTLRSSRDALKWVLNEHI